MTSRREGRWSHLVVDERGMLRSLCDRRRRFVVVVARALHAAGNTPTAK